MTIGEKVNLFFREVDGSFDVDTQFDQPLCQVVDPTGKLALQGAEGVTGSLFGTGFDQVGDGFRLGQIKFVVEKGAFAEFAGTCLACSQLQTALQQQIEYDWAAVALKLQNVFSGKRVRPREEQCDSFVENQPIRIEERAIVGMARFQFPTADVFGHANGQWAGHTYDPDTATTLGGGNSGNGFADGCHGLSR